MSIMLKSSFSLLGLVRDTDSFPTRRSSDLDDVPLGDQAGQLTRGERLPGEVVQPDGHRSEEHTSELQSRGHLVCRLLLEKRKSVLSDNTLRDDHHSRSLR